MWKDILEDRLVYMAMPGTRSVKNIAPRGQKYETLTSSGVKPEGHYYRRLFDSEQDAWSAYRGVLAEYVSNAGEVYFRLEPVLVDVGDKYSVQSRLAAL